MAEYKYTKQIDPSVFNWELRIGAPGSTFEYGGSDNHLVIESDYPKTTIDVIVASHNPDGLSSSKKDRILEVQNNTKRLMNQGVIHQEYLFECSVDYMNDIEGIYTTQDKYRDWGEVSTITKSFSMFTLKDKEASLSLLSDIADRIKYLTYNTSKNDDGSYSENYLINSIINAASQEDLDAIIDTRA